MVGHSAGGQTLQVGSPSTMHLWSPSSPTHLSAQLLGSPKDHRQPSHQHLVLYLVVEEAALCLRRRPANSLDQPGSHLTVHACLQRYAGANQLTVPVNYIIANAGTYMYLSDQRVSTQALSALNITCPHAHHSAACALTGADFTQPWDGGETLHCDLLANFPHISRWCSQGMPPSLCCWLHLLM